MIVNPESHISENMRSISDTYEVQVLIAYFLDQIKEDFTPAQLTEIVTGEGVVNYFVYTDVIEKMLAAGNLELCEVDGTEVYRLTEKGKEGAKAFKKLVPKSFRDKIYAAGLRLFAKLRIEKNVDFSISPSGNGYNIRCLCKDGNVDLMDISLYASDIDQANFIKSKIAANPSEFYCKIIDYLVDNDEYVPQISEDSEAEF